MLSAAGAKDLLRANPSVFTEPKEGQDVPVGIGDLEAPQPVVDEGQLLHERRPPLLELGKQDVGVAGVDVGIPPSPFVTGVVGTGMHVGPDRLEHDADPVPTHVTVVDVVGRPLEIQREAEALDVVRDRGLQILHDEERADRSEISFYCRGARVHLPIPGRRRMGALHWKVPHSITSRPAGSMRMVNRSTFSGNESTVMGRRATSRAAWYSVPHWPDWPLMMSETPPPARVGSIHSVYVPGCSGTPASAIGAEVVSCVAASAPVRQTWS